MLKVMIIDDEPANLNYLKLLIMKNAELNCIGAFTKPQEALESIKHLNPDAVFLDIEMPILLGTDLAQKIKAYNPNIQIVFITAFSQYAVEAFKVHAIHYLLKPISMEELDEVVFRLLEKKQVHNRKHFQWEIMIMGTFKVYNHKTKTSICWPTKKSEELFAYFVYQRNQAVEKSKLWDLLWPELDEKKAQHNLHNTIYRIKEIFKREGFEPHIQYKNNSYQFSINDFKCDAYEFEDFINRKLIMRDENLLEFNKAFELYKGILFDSRDYQWAYGWQLSLWNEYRSLGLSLAMGYLERGYYEAAEAKILRLLSLQPWDEDAYDLLISVYFRAGERIKLINTYKNLVEVLKEELNLEPRPSTKHLFEGFIKQLSSI
ncbi:response regulator [Cellulosilyticum sp. I15G10I2]|uniref:response regulator n=1 Tax=Cellulosilyticum sp. I15G10I2 TaxID=1892843 RepID=UPI00085C00DB|nr:response regulator [Cellulosilyticum sp. I15G10I2]